MSARMRHPAFPSAIGHDDHTDDPGVAGNARLTAATGLLLLALFAAEVVTVLLGVANVLSAHVVIGLLLTPPVLLKVGSTGWRMVCYYRGDRAYVQRGAPRPFLRILGPILVVLTLTLVGSGMLAFAAHGTLYTAALKTHKVMFYLWLVAVVPHTVPHFLHAVRLAAADLFTRVRNTVPAATARRAAVGAALLAGAVLAVVLFGHIGEYLQLHTLRLHL